MHDDRFGLVLLVAFLALTTLVHASGTQAHASIQRAIEDYLRVQTGGLPGEVTSSVGAIDPRLALAQCGALEVFTPPGPPLGHELGGCAVHGAPALDDLRGRDRARERPLCHGRAGDRRRPGPHRERPRIHAR